MLDIWRGSDDAGRPINMPPAVRGRYLAAWRGGRIAPAAVGPSPDPPAPCRFRGDDLTPAQRDAASLSHHKLWAPCGHPEHPLGRFACACSGCGPGCRGYAAESDGAIPPHPSVGIAVGCYGMPGLARLQVRARPGIP